MAPSAARVSPKSGIPDMGVLRATFEKLDCAVVVFAECHADNPVVSLANPAARRLMNDLKRGNPLSSLPAGIRQALTAVLHDANRDLLADVQLGDGSGRLVCVQTFDLPGDRVGVLLREVTREVNTRLRLERRESQLREAQAITHIGSWDFDVDGDSVEWSDEMFRVYGLDPDEFDSTYEGYLSRVHPDDRDRVHHCIQSSLENHLPFDHEERIIRPDGEVRVLHSRGRVSVDQHGKVRMFGTCYDITEEKQREQELRSSEARYRRLFEDDLTGNFVALPSGQLLAFNPAFAKLFGVDAQSRSSFFEHLEKADAERIRAELEGGEDITLRELSIKRGDGTPARALANIRGDLDDQHQLQEFRGNVLDLTLTRELQAKLHKAQRMEALGRVAGGVAHDLNNMLMVVFGAVSALRNRPGEPNAVKEAAGAIDEAAQSAAALVSQLLAFAKNQRLTPSKLDVNAVIQGTRRMLEHMVGGEVELVLDLAPESPTTIADKSQLEQVLTNLAMNGKDAMAGGGQLRIATSIVDLAEPPNGLAPGRYVEITVSDTGTGMSDEVAAQAFEPFFSTKTEGTGTGLGLATVYGIVSQSGGHISIQSQPGEGTTFEILLPMAPD